MADLRFDLKTLLTPLDQAVFTVMDTETTGLDPATSRLLEVTAIKYRNGQAIGKYTTLVNPGVSIPPGHISGITDQMVKGAPDLKTALRGLVDFVGPSPLMMGHYIHFDLEHIRHRLEEAGMDQYQDRFRSDRALCTKTLAQIVLPDLKDDVKARSLGPLAKCFGIVNRNPHRAESDVETTAQVFRKLLDAMKRTPKTIYGLRHLQGPVITRHDGQPRK